MSCGDALHWRSGERRLPPPDQLVAALLLLAAVALCLVKR